jgi:hypothetical protein
MLVGVEFVSLLGRLLGQIVKAFDQNSLVLQGRRPRGGAGLLTSVHHFGNVVSIFTADSFYD